MSVEEEGLGSAKNRQRLSLSMKFGCVDRADLKDSAENRLMDLRVTLHIGLCARELTDGIGTPISLVLTIAKARARSL